MFAAVAASTNRAGLRFASDWIGVLLLMGETYECTGSFFTVGTAACHNGKLVGKYANFEAAGDFMSGAEVRFSNFNECQGFVFLLFCPFRPFLEAVLASACSFYLLHGHWHGQGKFANLNFDV